MSMNISGLGNTYNGINTNSKQYKALKEKGWLSGIMQNEAMMSSEERMIYETFGGRDTIINNLMKQFDSDGDLLNANGVAGMDVTGKGTSWQQLTSVSEEYRQKMFDNVKREFIKENGISNGDTTKRSDIFKDYQLSVSKDKRLSGTWTLEQYEGQYRAAMYAAVKSANPNWKPGQKFDTSILDNVTRESVESTLVKNGNRLVRNSIDVSVQNTTSLVLEIRSNKLLHHGKSIKLGGIIELVYIVLQSVVKPGITGFFKIDLHIKCYIYLS